MSIEKRLECCCYLCLKEVNKTRKIYRFINLQPWLWRLYVAVWPNWAFKVAKIGSWWFWDYFKNGSFKIKLFGQSLKIRVLLFQNLVTLIDREQQSDAFLSKLIAQILFKLKIFGLNFTLCQFLIACRNFTAVAAAAAVVVVVGNGVSKSNSLAPGSYGWARWRRKQLEASGHFNLSNSALEKLEYTLVWILENKYILKLTVADDGSAVSVLALNSDDASSNPGWCK